MIRALVLIYFGRRRLGHTIKATSLTFQTVDPEICSILIFYKRVWNLFLYHILCMIFKEKYFSCYILLTKKISLSLLLGILGNMCIVIICCPVCDVRNFEIYHSFFIKPHFCITKKLGQKCKYLKNKKRFTMK